MTDPHLTTIAQISDVHLPFSNWAPWRYWNMKRKMGLLNWLRARRFVHRFDALDLIVSDMRDQKPDHTVVSGDLVNLGLPSQYKKALTWLQAVGPADTVSVIPGNHDIYTALSPNDEDCTTVWAAYMQSDAYGLDVLQGVDDPSRFPYIRKIGPIVLVGVNSAVPTPPFVAQGEVGPDQRVRLRQSLDALDQDEHFVCVVIHHPPLPGQTTPSRALRDSDHIQQILADSKVGLVLHGHNHRDMLTWLDRSHGLRGSIPVLGAASGSARRQHGREPLARYYIYEFRMQDHDMSVTRITRGLTSERNVVAELERVQILPRPDVPPR